MQVRAEVTGGVLRFYADGAPVDGPFLCAAYFVADAGVATIKGLSSDRVVELLSVQPEVREQLRALGIVRARWVRRREGRSDRVVTFEV